jgi:hypothetical protein
MSEPNASNQSEPDDELEAAEELQFDQAEYTTPAPSGPSCDSCDNPIVDEYFEANGKVFCTSCRLAIERHFRGGSRLARVIKALALGSVAAMAGAAIYYMASHLTHTNWGIIAVLVGFMVGAGVRKGTGNRGGLLYQFLAVFLTYTAIGAMNLALFFYPELTQGKQAADPKAENKVAKEVAAPKPVDLAQARPAQPAEGKNEQPAPAKTAPAEKEEEEDAESLDLLARSVFYLVMLFASPLLRAFAQPLTGLIYCFALWEAWRLNRAAKLSFNGPFRVSQSSTTGPGAEVVGDGE